MDTSSLALTIISMIIAFVSLLFSTIFSIRKERSHSNEKENEYVRFMQKIEDKLDDVNVGIVELKDKVKTIDNNVCDIQKKLAEQEQRIRHLEKEVFDKKK
ncbi:MAG: hypothetical protein SPJ27_04550 [Candidatus Onthovivens sp.]|nr:hypothetical protein [Candidatus Onthovivens sp.]